IRYVGTPIMRYIEFKGSVSSGSFAWHGDLLETLQILRQHQAVLTMTDIIRLHLRVLRTLLWRLAGAVARGHWRRAWFAVAALPTLAASLVASLVMFMRDSGGQLQRIPFKF